MHKLLEYSLAVGLGLSALNIAGCASPPKAEIAKAELALEYAESAGAQNGAPLEMRDAKKELDEAKVLAKKRDNLGAKRKAEKAQLGAEYAQAVTASKQWQKAVDEIKASQASLKQELDRSGNSPSTASTP